MTALTLETHFYKNVIFEYAFIWLWKKLDRETEEREAISVMVFMVLIRFMKIKWTNKIENEVLKNVGDNRSVFKSVLTTGEIVVYVTRHEGLLTYSQREKQRTTS